MKENSALCDQIADVQITVDVGKQEREFLLRKLIENDPSSIELMPVPIEPKFKKRKNSSSDASSVNKPATNKKVKIQQSLLKKQTTGAGQLVNPKLPLTLDGITLLNLGRIALDRPAYIGQNCIYPVGYKISRMHNNKMFICRIIDNGSNSPQFEAFLAIDPTNNIFSGPTADDCHAEVLQAFDNVNLPYVLDGDQFFGLTNNRIRDFIAALPNAKTMQIKQEIKQENLTFFDDNARSYMMS